MVLLSDWSQLHSAVRWPARYSIYIILVKMCLGAKESAVISSSTEGIRIDWRECITGEVRSFYLCRWGGRAGGACPRLLWRRGLLASEPRCLPAQPPGDSLNCCRRSWRWPAKRIWIQRQQPQHSLRFSLPLSTTTTYLNSPLPSTIRSSEPATEKPAQTDKVNYICVDIFDHRRWRNTLGKRKRNWRGGSWAPQWQQTAQQASSQMVSSSSSSSRFV